MAAGWRSLRRLVAQAVGNLAAWRKGRTSQYTLQRSVHTNASISLPDLGPWDPGWDFPSQEALAHTLCNAATSGNWAVQVTRVMLFIKSRTQPAVDAEAADSARCWRQWAKEACRGSAGAAHGFSKVGIDDGEVGGLARPELLVKANGDMVAAMVGRAQGERQTACRPGGLGRAARPSLEEVDDVCKTCKSTAGLGHDCVIPKAILQLPVELRVRFVGFLWLSRQSWSNLRIGLT